MASIETEVNRPAVPPEGTRITAEVDVEPGEQADRVERHIALCIDTSGSMSGAKISQARDGASWVFGLLEPTDYVSIVAFDSSAEVLLGPVHWGDLDREEAMGQIEALSAGGGTDMYAGLETARDSLTSLDHDPGAGEDAVRRLLLLSDGKDKDHTVGEFEALASDIDASGVRIEAAGIGEDYNQDTIRTLGTTARGKWTHLEAAGDIEEFFGEAVESASQVVAADAELQLDAADGVEVSNVYRALPQAQDVEPEWEANTATVKLPDLTERERQRVVMKVTAPAHEPAEDVPLVQVRLRARGDEAVDRITVDYSEETEDLAEANEEVQLDHRETVVRTQLGKGNVEAAETQVEQMTRIHGETEVVENIARETQVVKEGGKAERSRATKLVDQERIE
ncbi:MAG: VWA domain-containing protein [Haloarculaceae archaeon]